MESTKRVSYIEYVNREYQTFHEPLTDENRFYDAVKAGDVEMVEQLLHDHSMIQKKQLGSLSKNPLQNLKYHFAITAAVVARHCINGGMSRETAFNLSDYYINIADISPISKISHLLNEMLLDYTNRMRAIKSQTVCSREIWECIDYIYRNLHTRIYIEDIANEIGFNRSHLSKRFKAEMNENLQDYILRTKLENAKNMLLYSDYTISQISETLSFTSQSYFTKKFYQQFGETPARYRKLSHTKHI